MTSKPSNTLFKDKDKPSWFIDWQKRYYRSKRWQALRGAAIHRDMARSAVSGRVIDGVIIVDHIIEITPDNHTDPDIVDSLDNLQLLSQQEHNAKHGYTSTITTSTSTRGDINIL